MVDLLEGYWGTSTSGSGRGNAKRSEGGKVGVRAEMVGVAELWTWEGILHARESLATERDG